jgi:hypothetical protein
MVLVFFIAVFLPGAALFAQVGKTGAYDTIRVLKYFDGTDTFPFFYMPLVMIRTAISEKGKAALIEKSRLRRFIEETYPMAMEAADIVNEIRREKLDLEKNKDKRRLVKSKERELKSKYIDQIKNMYIGKGKVLIKLIYRETGITCYDLIKEMKSGINARFWQTLSFFFDGNLKQKYEPEGADAEMETIVKEVARWYGRS